MKRKNESMKESHCGHREHQRDRKWENMPRDTGNSGNGVITASEGRPKLRGRRIHESEVPVIAEDYMWMTDGDEPRVEDMRGMPILVAIDESTDLMGNIEERPGTGDHQAEECGEEGDEGRDCMRGISRGGIKVLGQHQCAYTNTAGSGENPEGCHGREVQYDNGGRQSHDTMDGASRCGNSQSIPRGKAMERRHTKE